jgi:hypothetical protein
VRWSGRSVFGRVGEVALAERRGECFMDSLTLGCFSSGWRDLAIVCGPRLGSVRSRCAQRVG